MTFLGSNRVTFSISKGDPSSFLPLIHSALLGVPHSILGTKHASLFVKQDDKFLDAVYALLRDDPFHYKPVLTKLQFFTNGYSERKCMFVSDMIQMVKKLHLGNKTIKQGRQETDPTHYSNNIALKPNHNSTDKHDEKEPTPTRRTHESVAQYQQQSHEMEETQFISQEMDINPPSRFISEGAWYNHLSRTQGSDATFQPLDTYPVPQQLVNCEYIEDSLMLDNNGGCEEEHYKSMRRVSMSEGSMSPLPRTPNHVDQVAYHDLLRTPTREIDTYVPGASYARGAPSPHIPQISNEIQTQLDAIQKQQDLFSDVLFTLW